MEGRLVVRMATKVSRAAQKPMVWKSPSSRCFVKLLVLLLGENIWENITSPPSPSGTPKKTPKKGVAYSNHNKNGHGCGGRHEDTAAEEKHEDYLGYFGESGLEEHWHGEPEEVGVCDDVAGEDGREDGWGRLWVA